jgi:5-methylthioribose kinase
MSIDFESRCSALLSELNLCGPEDVLSIKPLSGGVSSDIGLVELGGRKVVVKFALERLRVAEAWFANVNRSLAEYQWLQYAAGIVPDAVPLLLGCSETLKGFAMEYLDGATVYLWKKALLDGASIGSETDAVGDRLGRIHNGSVRDRVLDQFQNQEDFFDLRLEPYLAFTASRHPELAAELRELIEMLQSHERVLVHGDVSPKNIMIRDGVPIFLDAECATAGDPSFDIAFCLTHLILKAVHLKKARNELLASIVRFWQSYEPHVQWESAFDLERRVGRLLPAMMLARVDGKSPVEYLDEGEQQIVRIMAVPLLKSPSSSLSAMVETLARRLETG